MVRSSRRLVVVVVLLSAVAVADLVPLLLGSGAALACCVLNVDLPAVDQGLLLGASSAMVSSGACASVREKWSALLLWVVHNPRDGDGECPTIRLIGCGFVGLLWFVCVRGVVCDNYACVCARESVWRTQLRH